MIPDRTELQKERARLVTLKIMYKSYIDWIEERIKTIDKQENNEKEGCKNVLQ